MPLIAATLFLAVSERATAGIIALPCDPGSASPNGFEPCTPCAPGSFARFSGQDACQPCPFGAFAANSGATSCDSCGCNDHTACTVDRCAAATGVCSAEPIADCEPVTVGFAGTVTSLESPTNATMFPLGSPIEGHYVVDPVAPDQEPTESDEGLYSGAVLGFAIRAGASAAPIEATATRGDIYIQDDQGPTGIDSYNVRVPEPEGIGVDPAPADFTLSLDSEDTGTLLSDALLVGPVDVSLFEFRQIRFRLTPEIAAYSDDFVLTAPEPTTSSVAFAALAALAVLAAARAHGANA